MAVLHQKFTIIDCPLSYPDGNSTLGHQVTYLECSSPAAADSGLAAWLPGSSTSRPPYRDRGLWGTWKETQVLDIDVEKDTRSQTVRRPNASFIKPEGGTQTTITTNSRSVPDNMVLLRWMQSGYCIHSTDQGVASSLEASTASSWLRQCG
jgi:hypothetical protein